MSEAISWPEPSPLPGVEDNGQTTEAKVLRFPSTEQLELRSHLVELNTYSNIIISRAKGYDPGLSPETARLVTFIEESQPDRDDGLKLGFASTTDRQIFADILDEFEFRSEQQLPALGLFPTDQEGIFRLMIYECDPTMNPEYEIDKDAFISTDRATRLQFLEFLREKNYFNWFPEQ